MGNRENKTRAEISRLVRENWHLVSVTVERCYPGLSVSDREEVEGAGYLALTKAAMNYDAMRSANFKTHAIARIRYAAHESALCCAAGVFAHRRLEKWADLAQLPVAVPLEASPPTGDSSDRTQTFADLIPSPSADTETTVLEREAARDLWRVVEETLPPKQGAIIRAYYIEGKTLYQIAGEIGLTQQRVGQIHSRALGALRMKIPQPSH